MQSPKESSPVENEQADHHSTQRKIPRLKSFDARIERREPLPVQIDLANLEEPRAREHTVTEDVSPHGARVLTKTMLAARRNTAGYPLDGRVSEARSSRLLCSSAEGWLLCGHTIRRPPIQVAGIALAGFAITLCVIPAKTPKSEAR